MLPAGMGLKLFGFGGIFLNFNGGLPGNATVKFFFLHFSVRYNVRFT